MSELTPAGLKRALEAILFAAEGPLSLERLARSFPEFPRAALRAALRELVAEYQGRGIEIREVAGGFRFQTAPDLAEFVVRIRQANPIRLSRAALETLAIIAYRQPITRAEIEDIRGVDSSAPLKMLLERKLIKIVGRKEVLGRPLLYGTTDYFLEVFELRNLSDLPDLKELEDLQRPGEDESTPLFKTEKAAIEKDA